MIKWQTEINRNDRAQRVKSEYRKLLSVKVCNEDAERLSFDYAVQGALRNTWEEGRVWLALALKEWELGRLSENAKAQALKWIHTPDAPISAYSLNQLESTLLSPIPHPKKISAPTGIRKCPYPVGSLLAYRMISSPNLIDTPFWGKYVLLRVIKINRTPVTSLAPDACYNESMLVGLYDWMGPAIPDPNIVNNLNFTPIVLSRSDNLSVDFSLLQQHLSTDIYGDLKKNVRSIKTKPASETCCCLDWICVKGIDSNEVFTFLECDDSYVVNPLPFFDTTITAYSFAHSIPFDVMLRNRFEHSDFNHLF